MPGPIDDSALSELTAHIVSAYVENNAITPGDLAALITNIGASLRQLSEPSAKQPEPLTPPVPIKKTITPDYIISLEDGQPYKTLRLHLTNRGLTPDEYRAKWGLPADYPMVAANYSAARSSLAKKSGLGRKRDPKKSRARKKP